MTEQLAFLNKYLGLFDEQSESWKKPHTEVMQAYQNADALAESVAHGLFILERITRCSMGAPDSHTEVQVSIKQAKGLCEAYQWWYKTAGEILTAIETSERADFPVEGANDLRDAHQKLGDRMQGIIHLQHSIADFENGRAKPLKEVLDVLRNLPQPESRPQTCDNP
jgi:hypothetical protein